MKRALVLLMVILMTFSMTACDLLGENFKGNDGADGKTPYIQDGYWYIGGVSTGVKAEGNDGVTPTIEISEDGYWVINGEVTEYKAAVNECDPHSFGEWVRHTYDEKTPCNAWLYYRICTACNDIEWKSGGYEAHTLTTVTTAPTCKAGGYDENTCSVCGFYEKTNYTATTGHSYESTYSYNASFHWLDCKHCDAITAYAEHSVDDSGFCTICDQPLAPTEGLVYELSSDGTYAELVAYSGTAKRIVIADTYMGAPVTTICDGVFENSAITAVVIPDSVTTIGDQAFAYCRALTSVTIGDGITSIGSYAFGDCSGLKDVYVTDIAAWCNIAFDGYYANPLNNSSSRGNLYLNGELITELVIPDGVTSIKSYAFYNCRNITDVTIPDSVTTIGYGAFYYCSNLTSVTIGDGVTTIGNSAFDSCSKLTSVTLGNGITSIGSSFYDCHSDLYTEYEYGRYVGDANDPYQVLVSVVNKNLRTYTIHENTKCIAPYAFQDCERLETITIPDNVKGIGYSAFYECYALTSVTIPDSVTTIGSTAFWSCDALTSITIPDSVTTIGDEAFYYCFKLRTINFCGTEEEWAAISKGSYYKPSNCTIVYNYSGS